VGREGRKRQEGKGDKVRDRKGRMGETGEGRTG